MDPAAAHVPILIVDDRRDNLLAMASMLAAPDRDLVLAESGDEALRQLLRNEFALILLDVRMPHLDGFETAELIRSRERSRNIPIIFLTAGLEAEPDLRRAYALGAVDYVVKPVIQEVLCSKVDVFVELARSSRAARDLADARAQLLADLEGKNAELEAFTYTVSHDLRAPLRSIDGFSRILASDPSIQLSDQARSHLARVRAAAQRMQQLIDDLLALSKVTSGDLARERVDLSECARDALGELQRSDPERAVDAVIQPGIVVRGDPRLLRVALDNLLGNAWKFTRKRENASIELSRARSDDAAEVVCRIHDNGAGFDMSASGRMFRPFRRLHDDRDYPGTGIGLATVQRIALRHGGRVWAEGEIDRGATFYLALPAA